MKAEVLSSKGVLISDPSVKDMNRARWYFEWYGVKRKKRELVKDLAFLLVGDQVQELNDEEKPLKLIPFGYIVNPEVMDVLLKKVEEEKIIEEAMDDESYEEMLQRVEKSGLALDDIDLLEEEK